MKEDYSNFTVVNGGLLRDSKGNLFCPECKSSIEMMRHQNGCVICPICGWTKC